MQHVKEDFDSTIPVEDTPFFRWMAQQESAPSTLGSALRRYYNTATKAELKNGINPKQFSRLQTIFHRFVWTRR